MVNRIIDPKSGRVTIDGQDVSDLKLKSLRDKISVIPQNGPLFNDTILYNLQYGCPGISQEEIIEVCKKCQIHDKIIQMEAGYQTKVGELGSMLSGGERQRILIARGMLKKAEIFLFDEATSNLDSLTEKGIMESVNTLLKGKTIIHCAHRLSCITDVDVIHVLKDGQVVEQG